MATKTRYKDKHGQKICVKDFIHVEEYPDKYVGGSYDFEGIVEQCMEWETDKTDNCAD